MSPPAGFGVIQYVSTLPGLPTVGTAPLLWLRPDLSADTRVEDAAVSTLTNQSGTAGNATSAGVNRGTYKASGANSRPYIRFDKATNPQHMAGSITTSGASQTVFYVLHLDAHEAGNRRLFAFPSGTVDDISGSSWIVYDPNSASDVQVFEVVTSKSVVSLTSGTVHILMAKFDGTNSTSQVDAAAGTTVAATISHAAIEYIIAAGRSASAPGYLPTTQRFYEMAVYNAALSAGDITTVTNYMKTRYGIA